tara:strand:- start:160 stop:324 length:165 start_codon:yes stop_codon:yes gene_type:complete
VWANKNGTKLKVAGASVLSEALRYAFMYQDEGEVTVKQGNKILVRLPDLSQDAS